MLTTEIQQDTYTGPVTLNPRWLRIPSAVKYSGLSRSRLYELLAQGRIRSICLKAHRDALRGVRLVDRESIEDQVVVLPDGADAKGWYVSLSRARDAMHVYTRNKAALRQSVMQPGE